MRGPRREDGRRAVAGQIAPAAPASLAGRSRWLVLGAIAAVSFLLLLEDTAVSVALPEIRQALGMQLGELEWVVNAYTVALAVLVLPAGRLADYYGRRRVFTAGLIVFTLASLLAGLAPSGAALIAARSLQGIGAALASSAALSIISVEFDEGRRGAALGIWGGASAVGLAVGPVVGAMLTQMFGWEWVFLINVPLGAAAIFTIRLLIPESSAGEDAIRPPWGAVALWGAALLALVMALTEASSVGWGAPEVVGLGVTGVGLLVAFGLFERRARRRLIDPAVLHGRQTIGANVLSLLSTAVMCNLFFFIPLYLELVRGYDVVGAGTALLPLTAAIVLVAPAAGRLSDLIGARLPIVIGTMVLAGGLVVLSTLGEDSAGAVILGGLALAGVGIGMVTTPITAAALSGAGDGEAGQSAGLLNTSRTVGLSLGIATMGAIIAGGSDVLTGDPGSRAAFIAGLADALRINAGVALLAALIAVATISGHRAKAPMVGSQAGGTVGVGDSLGGTVEVDDGLLAEHSRP